MFDLQDRLNRTLADRYRVTRELGSGGMAVVFLADDLKHARQVAIKVMKPEIASELGARRFLREIETVASLSHPNILPLHDSGEADGLLYFVTPFVDGETLRDRLRRSGPLALEEAVRVTDEVADALAYAHDRGIIHRDVKPGNILFQAGHAVVADFGVARAVSAAKEGDLTETGLAIGTLKYMSPEQASGDGELDARADVYALGCVFFEMVTGEVPFEDSGPRAMLTKRLVEAPPSLGREDGPVPRSVQEVARKVLQPERESRFESAGAFASALKKAVTHEAIEQVELRRTRAVRRRRAAFATLVAVVSAGAWWLTTMARAPDIQLVAVLPLTSATDAPGQEFFVEGVHTDLIQELARADIRVISPTSVMRYRDTAMAASEVAAELGVDAVIEGSTSLSGGTVALDLRMTNGATDELIWFDSYGAALGDVMGLYADATRAIAARIGLELRPEVAAELASARTVSPEAYQALLQARYHHSRLSEEGWATALDYYRLALERDPDNAEALAGIAAVWTGRAQFGLVSAEEARAQGEPNLMRALELDSAVSEVQATLAARHTWGSWDWEAGERSFQLALASQPTNSTSRAYYSQLLHYLGRDQEASEQITRALREDPFNPQIRTLYAMDLNFLHRYGEAEEVLSDVLTRTPDYGMALSTLRTTYHLMGRYEDALDMWRASDARDAEALAALDRGHELDGYAGALRAKAQMLIERSDTVHVTSWQIGTLYTRAGDRERALEYLERAFDERDQNIPYLSVDPIFDDLRDEPRFRALIQRLGLPQRPS